MNLSPLAQQAADLIAAGKPQQAIDDTFEYAEVTGEWGPMLEVWWMLDPHGCRRFMQTVKLPPHPLRFLALAYSARHIINAPAPGTLQ